MNVQEFSHGVVGEMREQALTSNEMRQIDMATVEAVYQIVVLVIERINACNPDATDEQVLAMVKAPSPLQKLVFGNLVKKYLKELFMQLGEELINAILDYIKNLGVNDIHQMRNESLL